MKSSLVCKPWLMMAMLCVLHQGIEAQDPSQIRRTWVTVGLGWPVIGEFPPRAAVTTSVSHQLHANVFSARGVYTADACFTCDDVDEFWDLGLLYGRSTVAGGTHASVAAGPGLAGGHEAGSRANNFQAIDLATTVGLALEGQLFVRPGSGPLGFGLYGFADINARHSFYGVTLNLQIGRLR